MQAYLLVGPTSTSIDGGGKITPGSNRIWQPWVWPQGGGRSRSSHRRCWSPPVVVASATINGLQNHYAVLGVSPTASSADIKKAYRLLALKYHPDVSKDSRADEVFKTIHLAYDILSNETSRNQYDRALKFQEDTGRPSRGNWDLNHEFEDGIRIYRWADLRQRMQRERYWEKYSARDENSSYYDEAEQVSKEETTDEERGSFVEVLRSAFLSLFLMQTIGARLSLTFSSLMALLDRKLDAGYKVGHDYYVVLVGDMITEEALPTYQTMLNTLDGVRDETGASPTSWAIWTRAWTAEENRHGDLLNRYLYLSGRVDMRQIEKTIQYLIGSGMDPRTENSPYLGFIYTSFQERATFISHGNTARLAKEHGDLKLAQICGTIAADEKRHETAYTKIVEKLFEIDPDGTVFALADMMRKKISMPAHLMYDGQDDNLFEHFSSVTQRLGVYTAKDYADILEFLVGRWNVEKLVGLSGEGRKAQDYVCGLAPRIRRLEERAQSRAKQASAVPFSWIFGRQINL